MSKRDLCAAICLVAASVASPAQASIICEVNLNGRLGLDKGGDVWVDMVGAGILRVCNVSSTNAIGTTKETCAAWYSSLLTYKAGHGRAIFYFDTSVPSNTGLSSCADLGDWLTWMPYFLQSI